MLVIANIVVVIVVLVHIWALVLEMFLWTKPTGLRTFGQSLEQAQSSAVLAANQGLYNGFLAAGLIFGLLYHDPVASLHIKSFFLLCVIAAGVYGGMTVNRRIALVQGVPAVVALILLWLA